MTRLTTQQHADHVKMVIDNTYGFYSIMQQAYSDKYEKRLKPDGYNNRLRFMVTDAMTWCSINEFEDKSEMAEDTIAVEARVLEMCHEGYTEYAEDRAKNA